MSSCDAIMSELEALRADIAALDSKYVQKSEKPQIVKESVATAEQLIVPGIAIAVAKGIELIKPEIDLVLKLAEAVEVGLAELSEAVAPLLAILGVLLLLAAAAGTLLALGSRFEGLESQISSVAADLSRAIGQIGLVKSIALQAKGIADEAISEIKNIRSLLQVIETRILENVNGLINQLRIELRSYIDGLITGINNRIDDLSNLISRVIERIVIVENRIGQVESLVTVLKTSIAGINSRISAIESSIPPINELASIASNKADRALSQIVGILTHLGFIDSAIGKINSEISSIESDIDDIYNIISNIKTSIVNNVTNITNNVINTINNTPSVINNVINNITGSNYFNTTIQNVIGASVDLSPVLTALGTISREITDIKTDVLSLPKTVTGNITNVIAQVPLAPASGITSETIKSDLCEVLNSLCFSEAMQAPLQMTASLIDNAVGKAVLANAATSALETAALRNLIQQETAQLAQQINQLPPTICGCVNNSVSYKTIGVTVPKGCDLATGILDTISVSISVPSGQESIYQLLFNEISRLSASECQLQFTTKTVGVSEVYSSEKIFNLVASLGNALYDNGTISDNWTFAPVNTDLKTGYVAQIPPALQAALVAKDNDITTAFNSSKSSNDSQLAGLTVPTFTYDDLL